MNKNVYNLDDLYIFELYEKVYDDEYYDENIDYYVKNTFFKLKDYVLCYLDDNKNIVDAIKNEEVKLFSNDLKDNDDFILCDIYRKLNYYVVDGSKDIDVSRKVLIDLWNIVRDNLHIENINCLNELYYISAPIVDKGYYPSKDVMIYYSDKEEYFDEYKEYKKLRLLMSKGSSNNNIVM